jgi:hypothetical protein
MKEKKKETKNIIKLKIYLSTNESRENETKDRFIDKQNNK